MQGERNHQRRGDSRHDNGQRTGAHARDLGKVEAKAQQDNRVLQDLLRGELDTGRKRQRRVVLNKQRQHHTDEDGEDRPADHVEALAQKPCRQSDKQA